MSLSYWQIEKPKKPIKTDIAIIGGGIMGASVAYWLSKYRKVKFVLIEKDFLASKASGRNAGFLISGTAEHYCRIVSSLGNEKAKKLWELTLENHNLLKEEIIDKNKVECDYRRCGSYILACSENEFEEIGKSAELLNKDGFFVELIERNEINKRLETNSFFGAYHNPGDAEMDPVKLVKGIALAGMDESQIFESNEVAEMKMNDQFEVEIKTNKNDFVCHMAVLCTNAYSPLLDDFFKDKVFPVRGQMFATEPVSEVMFDNKVIYADFGYEYFRQLENKQILIGGFRQRFADKEVGYSDEVTQEVQDGLYDFLTTRFPQLKGIKVTHRWAGIMGFSLDGLPLVGSLPKLPNVICAVGFTGHGMSLAFALGKAIAESLIEDKRSRYLEIFSVKRLV